MSKLYDVISPFTDRSHRRNRFCFQSPNILMSNTDHLDHFMSKILIQENDT